MVDSAANKLQRLTHPGAAMERTLSLSDVWNTNVTTSSSSTADADDVQTLYFAHVGHTALKIIYFIIGTVGVLDNLFVIAVFACFVRIADKVFAIYSGAIDKNSSIDNNCAAIQPNSATS